MNIDVNSDRSEKVKYDYPDFPIYVRKGLLSVFPNYTAASHWHDDIELILILSGRMLYNVNGEIVALNKGEGIFVNSRQLHFGFSDDKTECEYICILFHPFVLCTVKSFETEYVEPILNSGMAYIHLLPQVMWQNRILKHIQDIYDCKDEREAPLYAQGYICFLWSQVLAHAEYDSSDKQIGDSKLTILKTMIDYVHQHYSEKITLEDIAKVGHISKRTCGTVFLKYLNKTPMGFLIEHRLRVAIELMKTSDMTILEISLAVGFAGASYFSETFRKNFGVSPTEYRKGDKI